MRTAITGGTGFVGRHLARALVAEGHEAVLVARGRDERDRAIRSLPGARMAVADVADEEALTRAFDGCDAVAHCAGVNREMEGHSFWRVHVLGTRAVVAAARRAGVKKVALLSFLRARPGCGMRYHETNRCGTKSSPPKKPWVFSADSSSIARSRVTVRRAKEDAVPQQLTVTLLRAHRCGASEGDSVVKNYVFTTESK